MAADKEKLKKMDRVNGILHHEIYRACYGKIEECEKERIFCHHDMAHFLDVARLAMIINMQEQIHVPAEMIYGAALLHDIGRFRQYMEDIPHELASAQIAPDILKECGFTEEETTEITEAIRQHRNAGIKDERNLTGLIYRADKMSRRCFACQAEKMCDWKTKKKNMEIIL